MDLLKEIKSKIEYLAGNACVTGIKAAVRHIEAAERHLSHARAEHEDDSLNDVVYRSNQAFEGMLKEAYSILKEKDASNVSPYQIEKQLLEDNALSPRVLDLFTNYRQNWRNPSTHDHTLFFSDQEALLAIVSVSAFAAVLVDQIIEVLSYRKEQKATSEKRSMLSNLLEGYDKLKYIDQVVSLLRYFSAEISKSKEFLDKTNEAEIVGRLTGFLASIDPRLEIARETVYEHRLRPDLVITRESEKIIIEMKRARVSRGFVDSAMVQLSKYLKAIKAQYGILYIPPFEPNQEMQIQKFDTASGQEIVILSPVQSKTKDNKA